MADIFVSYASDDRDRVAPLVHALEKKGYTVWWDRRIQGGSRFADEIEVELTEARAVLVVWTSGSVRSHWVADEAEAAQRANKLIPIRLDNIDPPIGFRQFQTLDFSRWMGTSGDATVETLIEAVANLFETGSAALRPNARQGQVQNIPKASVAVLPFVNLSAMPGQDFFSDGISEDLLNLLAKVKKLKVTARTSSFEFKGKNQDISRIGGLLNVAHILEGSVRRSGDRVRITAQLIETETGYHIWSETYDRVMDDIFAIQDEISFAIVEELKIHILGDVKAPEADRSESVQAYEHYLMGQQFLGRQTREPVERSKSEFELALSIDPDYVPALVGLADAHILLSDASRCIGTTPVKVAQAHAKPFLDRAIELDPGSEEACTVFSFYEYIGGDYRQACIHAEKAIELNPNHARAYRLLGLSLLFGGDPRAPLMSARKKAHHLDPLSLLDLFGLSGDYLRRGRFDQADILLEKVHTINPASHLYQFGKTTFTFHRGQLKETLEILRRDDDLCRGSNSQNYLIQILILMGFGHEVEDIQPMTALLCYCFNGFADDADRLGSAIEETSDTQSDYFSALTFAMWHAHERRYEKALSLISPFDEPNPDKWGVHFNAEFDYTGARYSYFLRKELGDREGANFYLTKLRELYQIQISDPDGPHYAVFKIGALIAIADGNPEKAIDEIEKLYERAPLEAHQVAIDPLFADLTKEPRFRTMAKKAKDIIETERQAAIAAALLPPSQELITLMKS